MENRIFLASPHMGGKELEYIQEAHEEYMKQPGSVENDCKYITTVCSRVLASMPQFAEVPVMAYAG